MRYQIFLKDKPVTSMEGVSISFSEEQLKGIADRYDPALHEAPIIIGHPAHDAPAFGWVKGLSFGDDALSAEEHLVNADFDAMRKTGAFRKVSARFYTPKSANNPTPGEYYLRDIGFLGAMPPAVKGLKLASFADDSELVTAEISFGDLPGYFGLSISRMFGRWRDHLIETLGLEKADQIAPAWEINSMSETAQRADMQPRDAATPALSSFADAGSKPDSNPLSTPEKNPMDKTPEQLAAELAAANERNAALEAKQAKIEADARTAEAVSFCDGLIAAAKWPAAHKDVLVATLTHLAKPVPEGEALSFGEGEAAQPLATAVKAAFNALPPMVSFTEIATKTKAGSGEALSDQQVADRARAYKAKADAAGSVISFTEAVDAVNAGKDAA